MKALVALMLLQFGCRLVDQTVGGAFASTVFSLLFVFACYRWGGWTSTASAWAWLRTRPLIAWLVGSGVIGTVGLMIYNGSFGVPAMVGETIGAYFFFHAFCAVGDRLIGKTRQA